MYVADVHALGWYFTDDPRLGQQAAQVVERSERGNFVITELDLAIIKKLSDTHPLTELHDQLIVATALLYEAPVLTKDSSIRDSGLVGPSLALHSIQSGC